MTIIINDAEITAEAIDAEVQYHPAPSLEEARQAAAEALVIRELLLQEARRAGISADTDEAVIAALLENQLRTLDPDEETCRRYYANNRRRFRSPDLFEAQHILIAADPEDAAARQEARARAASLLAEIERRPEAFEALAREHSACPSKDQGGHLGQITRGATVPEFETFLCSLDEGELCPQPVESRYGFHVLRLLRRETGRELPYEAVASQVADYLRDGSWRIAVRHYILNLAGQAKIQGIDLGASSSPLLQ